MIVSVAITAVASHSMGKAVRLSKEQSVLQAPSSVDWREKGVVTPVHNQGEVSSSLLFGFLDALESHYAIEHQDHLEYASAAELIDCCGQDAHFVGNIYACVQKLGGLCSNSTYVRKPGTCNKDSCTPMFTFKHEVQVLRGSERALQAAVTAQPVMVTVDASDADFRVYRGGVLTDAKCSSTRLDHSMLAVGFGETSDGVNYWILKNSWGASWGEHGYLLLAKDHGNMCGVASEATFPGA
ncbi:procathepsin L-like [Sycon ciliatum]|uniref:procathepsin L-like n=1 Tax=Sycon ciliatum TaxID=27933 RepID=UPI0031F64817